MEELREKGTEMEQDEEGPSMSSKEENIENLPFFGEAHRESASLSLSLFLSLSFFLLVMDTYGYTPIVPACSRNEQRRTTGRKGSLSLSANKKLITESSRRKETAPRDPFLIPSIFPHWSVLPFSRVQISVPFPRIRCQFHSTQG